MRIAVFGGTFNPIHIGHINVIKCVLKELKPDKLILMPTHIPPHKSAHDLASDEHRLEMCRLAAAEFSGVSVDDYELKSEGRSYTVATMEHLREVYPSDELYFVMGSDMTKTFLSWYQPKRITELCELVCLSRSDEDSEVISKYVDDIRAIGAKCYLLSCDPVEISSTRIRADIIAYGKSFGMLLSSVEEYIIKNKLYNFDKTKYNKYVDYLRADLSEKRFIHSMNVADEALRLAVLNDSDRSDAYFAGLVHDICKEIPIEEQLELVKRSKLPVTDVELKAPKTYHAIAAAVYLNEAFRVTNEQVLSAVRYHTVAKGGMTVLEKIVYMADLISMERDYKDVDEIRRCTHADINLGMKQAMIFTVKDSVKKCRPIPHITLDCYNEFIGL